MNECDQYQVEFCGSFKFRSLVMAKNKKEAREIALDLLNSSFPNIDLDFEIMDEEIN